DHIETGCARCAEDLDELLSFLDAEEAVSPGERPRERVPLWALVFGGRARVAWGAALAAGVVLLVAVMFSRSGASPNVAATGATPPVVAATPVMVAVVAVWTRLLEGLRTLCRHLWSFLLNRPARWLRMLDRQAYRLTQHGTSWWPTGRRSRRPGESTPMPR